jgi:spore germination cell wall hydrolase CwlJ-like protein
MRLISDDAIEAVTVYQEAEGEPYEGKLGVAEALRNRRLTRYSSDGTVAGTALRALQFSGWNTHSNNRVRSVEIDDSDPVVQDCIRAVNEAAAGSQTVKGAVLYFNPAIVHPPPTWADPAKLVATVGRHQFYSA